MKIIKDFKSEEQYKEVLDKLKEYEGLSTFIQYTNNIELFIYPTNITYDTNNKSNEIQYHDWIKLSAHDYLHPVKLGDLVEVQDDSEYNGNIYKITCVGDDNDFRLEHAVHQTIWRHQDCLQVLKENKDEIKEFPIGTKVIVKDDGETYTTAKSFADYIGCNNYKENTMPKNGDEGIVSGSQSELNVIAVKISGTDYLLNSRGLQVLKEEPESTIQGLTPDVAIMDEPMFTASSVGDATLTEERVMEMINESKMKYKIGDYITVSFTNQITKGKGYKIINIVNGICNKYAYEIRNNKGIIVKVSEHEADLLDTAKELDKQFITNNKTMNTIETEMNAIANEEYFANIKNIKAITKADKEMGELISILSISSEEIANKYSRLSAIRRNFNNSYDGKDSEAMVTMLKNHKAIKEFITNFIGSTVSDLGEEEVKEEAIDVEAIFNS